MLFGLEILEIIFCIFVIGVGGFLRGFLGFGAALVIVPSLSIVLPPVFAIGILVIIEIPTIERLRSAGVSKVNAFYDGLKILNKTIRLLFVN